MIQISVKDTRVVKGDLEKIHETKRNNKATNERVYTSKTVTYGIWSRASDNKYSRKARQVRDL